MQANDWLFAATKFGNQSDEVLLADQGDFLGLKYFQVRVENTLLSTGEITMIS